MGRHPLKGHSHYLDYYLILCNGRLKVQLKCSAPKSVFEVENVDRNKRFHIENRLQRWEDLQLVSNRHPKEICRNDVDSLKRSGRCLSSNENLKKKVVLR